MSKSSTTVSEILKKPTVLVLWSGKDQEQNAKQVVDWLVRELSKYCHATVAQDIGKSASFSKQSQIAIDNANYYLFVVDPGKGPSEGVSAEDEWRYIKRLMSDGTKARESLRFIATKSVELIALAKELSGLQLIELESLYSGGYTPEIKEWLGAGQNHHVFDFPEEEYIKNSPLISALIWTLQFRKIEYPRAEGIPSKNNRDFLVGNAIQQLGLLKSLHSIHSTIGPAIERLVEQLHPPRQNIGPMNDDSSMLGTIREKLHSDWSFSSQELRSGFEDCIDSGLLPVLKFIALRVSGAEAEIEMLINDLIMIVSAVRNREAVPNLGTNFVNYFNTLLDMASMHGSDRLMVSDTMWRMVNDKTGQNATTELWKKVLSDSEDFYLAFFRFLLAFVVLFGILKIQKATLTDEEKEYFIEHQAILGKLLEIIRSARNKGLYISNELVKQSNILILDYIEALESLMREEAI